MGDLGSSEGIWKVQVVALMVLTELLTARSCKEPTWEESPEQSSLTPENRQKPARLQQPQVRVVEGLGEVWFRHDGSTISSSQGCSELTSAGNTMFSDLSFSDVMLLDTGLQASMILSPGPAVNHSFVISPHPLFSRPYCL